MDHVEVLERMAAAAAAPGGLTTLIADTSPERSVMFFVAKTPRPNFAAIVRASFFQPDSTHFDSNGVLRLRCPPIAMGTAAKSISLLEVRKYITARCSISRSA